jgi:hypothetical protein
MRDTTLWTKMASRQRKIVGKWDWTYEFGTGLIIKKKENLPRCFRTHYLKQRCFWLMCITVHGSNTEGLCQPWLRPLVLMRAWAVFGIIQSRLCVCFIYKIRWISVNSVWEVCTNFPDDLRVAQCRFILIFTSNEIHSKFIHFRNATFYTNIRV